MLNELRDRENDLDSKMRVLQKERRDLERAFTRKDRSVGILSTDPTLSHGFKSQASLALVEGRSLKDKSLKRGDTHSSSDSTAEDRLTVHQSNGISRGNHGLFESAVSNE